MEPPVSIQLYSITQYHGYLFFPAYLRRYPEYAPDYVRQFNNDRTGMSTLSFRECHHRECHPIAILEDPRFEDAENFFVTIEKGHGVIPRMTFTDVEAEIIIEDVTSMYVLLWKLIMSISESR